MSSTVPSNVPPNLSGALVLIVEDEPFIAYDLVLAIEDAEGVPVGPAATVRHALDLMHTTPIVAAIVDVTLADGDVVPVLEALNAQALPVLVHTATALPQAVAARFEHFPVYTKPIPASRLAYHLACVLEADP